MAKPKSCAECGGEMEKGFLPEFTKGEGGITCWHPGEPKRPTFLGLSVTDVPVAPSSMLPLQVWRCTSCGLLRFYAGG